MHSLIETVGFSAQLDRLGVTVTERGTIYDTYSSDPAYGAVVKQTGGLRKGRIAKDDTGKSGGYRVFSFAAGRHAPTYLIWIIDKTKNATLTNAQEALFKTLTAELKRECT